MTARHLHHRENSRWWRRRVWRLQAYLFSCSFSFSRQNIMMEYLLIDSGSCWIFLLCHGSSWLCRYFHVPHQISISALVGSLSCRFLLRLLALSGLYLTYTFLNLKHKGRQWMPKFPKTTSSSPPGWSQFHTKKRWRVRDTVLGAVLIFITKLAKHSIFRESIFIYRENLTTLIAITCIVHLWLALHC